MQQPTQIINSRNNKIIASNAQVADNIIKRIIGLLGHEELNPGEALILRPCDSIHTFFMRFPIDVVFINRKNKVVKTISNLRPWRLSGICFFSYLCLELPVGTIARSNICSGDTITFFPPLA